MNEHQAGIDSIETGMRLLTALAARRTPQMLKTLAADADMPPAKAHRYMVSFVRAGYVDREPISSESVYSEVCIEPSCLLSCSMAVSI